MTSDFDGLSSVFESFFRFPKRTQGKKESIEIIEGAVFFDHISIEDKGKNLPFLASRWTEAS
jgi:hypothetical protein